MEGRVGWVGAQRLSCLLEVPRHRGVVKAKALGDLRHRLSRLVEYHHLFHQLWTQVAVDPPWRGVVEDVVAGARVSALPATSSELPGSSASEEPRPVGTTARSTTPITYRQHASHCFEWGRERATMFVNYLIWLV